MFFNLPYYFLLKIISIKERNYRKKDEKLGRPEAVRVHRNERKGRYKLRHRPTQRRKAAEEDRSQSSLIFCRFSFFYIFVFFIIFIVFSKTDEKDIGRGFGGFYD